jgi:hypothetical protein
MPDTHFHRITRTSVGTKSLAQLVSFIDTRCCLFVCKATILRRAYFGYLSISVATLKGERYSHFFSAHTQFDIILSVSGHLAITSSGRDLEVAALKTCLERRCLERKRGLKGKMSQEELLLRHLRRERKVLPGYVLHLS